MPLIAEEVKQKTVFVDRIVSLVKVASKKRGVERGGKEGGLVLRVIQKTKRSTPFLSVHFFSMIVLLSNITSPPIELNEEERKMSLWLTDTSQGRKEHRKFIITFYDDLSFARFNTLCTSLAVMMAAKKKAKEAPAKGIENNESYCKRVQRILDEDSINDDDDLFCSPFDGTSKDELENVDFEALHINYGESQDLYKPELPFGCTKK